MKFSYNVQTPNKSLKLQLFNQGKTPRVMLKSETCNLTHCQVFYM